MEDALGDDAFLQLHGPHVPAKRYVPPFLQNQGHTQAQVDHISKNIYDMEIEAGLGGHHSKVEEHHMEVHETTQDRCGGPGGNIRDMKFLRLKIKTLRVEDNDLLQELIDQSFAVTIALPLADVYNQNVQDQFIKLTNYDTISMNEFDFCSQSLFNFKVSDETFNNFAAASLQVMIDGKNTHGQLQMNRLVLANNF